MEPTVPKYAKVQRIDLAIKNDHTSLSTLIYPLPPVCLSAFHVPIGMLTCDGRLVLLGE